jgi:hypothetical protein
LLLGVLAAIALWCAACAAIGLAVVDGLASENGTHASGWYIVGAYALMLGSGPVAALVSGRRWFLALSVVPAFLALLGVVSSLD